MASDYKPDQLRGHSDEADGIEEYDNKLPGWWVWLFIFTILWGGWEFIDWHVSTPRSLAAAYEAARATALAAAGPAIDIEEIEIVMSPEAIAAGAEIYTTYCVACHAADGTGGVGANLIDEEWIHGNDVYAMRGVVANGVLEKGMPAWLPVIGADGLANVVAFVADMSPTAVVPSADAPIVEEQPEEAQAPAEQGMPAAAPATAPAEATQAAEPAAEGSGN